MSEIHIYRASKGKYLKPVQLSKAGLNWVDGEDNSTACPKKIRCDHPKHWEWGTGTRNGQKLIYLSSEMFYQKYHLTMKELKESVKQYDMASLEMKGRIICQNCAEKETQNKPIK